MCKIYIDFDGVLVDTPKYINQEIKKHGNTKDTFISIEWEKILKKCNEVYNNISYIKQVYKDNDITILTHVYSQDEVEAKKQFIIDKIGDINIMTVPYEINKNQYVDPKNNILIDDYHNNIAHWIKDGGIGILFDNNSRLEDILYKYL